MEIGTETIDVVIPQHREDTTRPVLSSRGGRRVAMMPIDQDMIDRLRSLLPSEFTRDYDNFETDLRLFHALNACGTALIK